MSLDRPDLADHGPGLELDFFAGISASLGDLHKKLDDRDRWSPPQPTDRDTLAQAGIYPSAGGGMLALNLGAPDQDYRWNVRSIRVGGLTPTTVAAGRADIFVVANAPVIPAPTATDSPGKPGWISGSGFVPGISSEWKDTAASLPLVAFYGRGELVVRSGQGLWVVISSGTGDQPYVGSAKVDEFAEGPYTVTQPT